MEAVIFYSWQSDLPNNTNRSFIQTALENAAQRIREDKSISVEPVIDRDTSGVPGTPDIAHTIFEKIDRADVFVCDLTIVNSQTSTSRPTPNPNVLIELGYAWRALGNQRVLLVQNTAYGGPEVLPFDLRTKRVITYSVPPNISEKAPERRNLERKFEEALKHILTVRLKPVIAEEGPSIEQQVIDALENIQPNRNNLVRKYMDSIVSQLELVAPQYLEDTDRDDLLIASIDNSLEIVASFARVSKIIATTNSTEALKTLFHGFERIIEQYIPTSNPNFNESDGDYYRFMGHELFVSLVAHILQEDNLELVKEILNEVLYVDNIDQDERLAASFSPIYDPVRLLIYRRNRLQLDRLSLHADLLHNRHTNPPLNDLVPFDRFMEADFFLFLLDDEWFPWSFIYCSGNPIRFLRRAEKQQYAAKLVAALNLSDIDGLKERIETCRKIYQDRILRLSGHPPRCLEDSVLKIGSK